MSREKIVDTLVRDHHLDVEQAYLLNLIPVIELMWADDRLQQAEISLLYEYAIQWVSLLSADSDGAQVVSIAQVNQFIERYTHERPAPKLLAALGELAHQFMEAAPETMLNNGRDQQLIDHCLDIAAASVTQYPYDRRSRITSAEKKLLTQLISRLSSSASKAAV